MKVRRKKRKFTLIRPADGIFPLAILAGEILGEPMYRGWIFASWFAVRLFGLFSADAVRMAYATQPGMRRVKGSTTLAMLMQIAGAVLAAGVYALVFKGITPFTLVVIGIGALINIEQVFCEYLYAAGDGQSPVGCGILTGILLVAGMMMDAPGIPWITLGMAIVACLISVIISVVVAEFRPCRINGTVIRHALRGLIYGLSYPVLAAVLIYMMRGRIAGLEGAAKTWCETGLRTGFYLGLALTAVVRTPFRRSRLESRTMIPATASAAVMSAIGWTLCRFVKAIPVLPALAVSGFCLCIFAASMTCILLWGGVKKEY